MIYYALQIYYDFSGYSDMAIGLCRSMGRVTGQLSRMTLSYDFVFLAAYRMALCGIVPEIETRRCAVRMKKRPVMKENAALEYTAAAAALLTAAKNEDDIRDEKGLKRARSVTVKGILNSFSRRGRRLLPEDCGERLGMALSELSALENEKSPSADATAGRFGEALGIVFSGGLEGEAAEKAYRAGAAVGRFVYVCDAAEDLADDIRKDRYNPLRYGWGDLALGDDGRPSGMVRESIRISLPSDIGELAEDADALDPSNPMTPIVRNTVYMGLPKTMERVLEGRRDGRAEMRAAGRMIEKDWKR